MKFNIDSAMKTLKKEVLKFQLPVVDLIKIKTKNKFKILVSAILSSQTKDTITAKASKNLFKKVKNSKDLEKISQKELEELIYPVSFYRNKARFLKKLPKYLKKGVPDKISELVKIPGVGRKVANLVVTVAFNKPGICVDTHVHRITNRWGYVKTKTPNETEKVLRQKLPKKYWTTINSILVAYGQNLCTPISPHCSKCKINEMCKKTGVKRQR